MKRTYRFIRLLIASIIITAGLNSCEDEPALFTLQVTPMAGAEVLSLNKPYVNDANYKYQVNVLRLYMSNLTLIKNDDTEILVKDVDFLADYQGNSADQLTPTKIVVEVPAGEYKGIRLGLGVDSTLNNLGTADYPREHPLSIYQSTYWSWNTGFRFMLFQGRYDATEGSTGDGSELGFSYHPGTNALYREKIFVKNFNLAGEDSYTFDLKLDVETIFSGNDNPIDLPNEPFSHTTGSFNLAKKVMDNLTEVGIEMR